MMTKKKTLLLQLSMNLITLWGVIYFNWSVFALIYLYWLETVCFVFFNGIKILTAQNDLQKAPHTAKALRYLSFNLFILLFYLIFIVGFIGFSVASKQEGVHFASYLLFYDHSFRYTVLCFFVLKLIELIYFYFLSGIYKTSRPSEFNSFFNIRMILIHIVIVLGFFTFSFISRKLNSHYGIIAFAAVFVIVKSIVDSISILYFDKTNKTKGEVPFL